jgi:Kef-type K+ transport system membrane component KefB
MSQQTLAMLTAIFGAAVLAPFISDRLAKFMAVPPVVVQIALGIMLGPAVFGWVSDTEVIGSLADLGLAFLMFLAGYEIQLARIRGGPLRRSVASWGISFAVGITIGIVIGGPTAGLVIGLALTTTALGTILPILRDSGESDTPFGDKVLAIGAVGEFAPIVAIAFILSGERPLHTLAVISLFAVIAIGGAWLARQPRHPRLGRLVTATLGTSAQVGLLLCVFVVVGMFAFAEWIGLDPVLGAFAAGIVVRLFLESGDPEEAEVVLARLEGLGFGFFIPIFFIVSGVRFDLDALVSDIGALVMVPVFLVLFLVVRGVPTALVHLRVETRSDRAALALLASTALPLVVVITTVGVDAGVITSATAASLVGAGMLSVLIFPALALRLRKTPHAEDRDVHVTQDG